MSASVTTGCSSTFIVMSHTADIGYIPFKVFTATGLGGPCHCVRCALYTMPNSPVDRTHYILDHFNVYVAKLAKFRDQLRFEPKIIWEILLPLSHGIGLI